MPLSAQPWADSLPHASAPSRRERLGVFPALSSPQMEGFEEHRRASRDDPRLPHRSYRSPLLPQPTPPIPTRLCSCLPASPQLRAALTPLNTSPAIRAGAPQPQPRSEPSSGARRKGFYVIFPPPREGLQRIP